MTEVTIKFVVHGKPEGQPRPRATVRGKHAGVYNPPCDWKRTVAAEAVKHRPPKPLCGPVRVDWTMTFPRPQSHYGTGRNAGVLKASAPRHHPNRPDRDNLDKVVLDCLSELGYWRNDTQVCSGFLLKLWGERGGAVVEVTELAENGDSGA